MHLSGGGPLAGLVLLLLLGDVGAVGGRGLLGGDGGRRG